MEMKRDSFFQVNKKGQGRKEGNKKEKEFEKGQEFKKKRLDKFNKNRVGVDNDNSTEEKSEKKPFDKKTYRLKKYSKKYKLEQWEEQRKKQLLRDYKKSIQNEPGMGSYKPVSFDEDATDSNQEIGKFVRHPDLIEKDVTPKKKDPFLKAKEQYNKIKQDKIDKQQKIEKAKDEKKQKLQEYKKKKQERFRKLSKKTKKGQPMMTGRLELLLEKIQKSK